MPQYSQEKVACLVQFCNEHFDGLSKCLVNCLIEPNHLVYVLQLRLSARCSPEPQHRCPQRTVFSHHLPHFEPLSLTLTRMASRGHSRRGGGQLALSFRLSAPFFLILRQFHVADQLFQDFLAVVFQPHIVKVPRSGQLIARKIDPRMQDGGVVLGDEYGKSHNALSLVAPNR